MPDVCASDGVASAGGFDLQHYRTQRSDDDTQSRLPSRTVSSDMYRNRSPDTHHRSNARPRSPPMDLASGYLVRTLHEASAELAGVQSRLRTQDIECDRLGAQLDQAEREVVERKAQFERAQRDRWATIAVAKYIEQKVGELEKWMTEADVDFRNFTEERAAIVEQRRSHGARSSGSIVDEEVRPHRRMASGSSLHESERIHKRARTTSPAGDSPVLLHSAATTQSGSPPIVSSHLADKSLPRPIPQHPGNMHQQQQQHSHLHHPHSLPHIHIASGAFRIPAGGPRSAPPTVPSPSPTPMALVPRHATLPLPPATNASGSASVCSAYQRTQCLRAHECPFAHICVLCTGLHPVTACERDRNVCVKWNMEDCQSTCHREHRCLRCGSRSHGLVICPVRPLGGAEFCFAWNASGACRLPDCRRMHACIRCGNAHPAFICPENVDNYLHEYARRNADSGTSSARAASLLVRPTMAPSATGGVHFADADRPLPWGPPHGRLEVFLTKWTLLKKPLTSRSEIPDTVQAIIELQIPLSLSAPYPDIPNP
ncbi:hypothetical protein BDK51DRAFT_43055 [Blyttiomyces helicus]|uniref:C3H1-type domain-containing protein n=1 Tax=Blyttiomyces helicus TaxID=388810 RepID=A0A4V1IPI2_9FUNG|nr:hypothetical protein BDK51DRAFT_43055 [Blyttiomyces helicus]|eukprot:RKO83147.1 hypothetical protein BDK51DRAFT_43055 [Blyttiomyces helicus]